MRQQRKLGFQLSFSPEEYKEGYYWLMIVAVWNCLQMKMVCFVDINECLDVEKTCGPHAMCKNLPGHYKCTCHLGYEMSSDKMCKGT